MGVMLDKYNRFLEGSGFSTFNKSSSDVLYRSTNPLTLDSIGDISLDLIEKDNIKSVKNILEIGRSNGYSFGFFKFCFPAAKVISIDIVRTETSVKMSKVFDDNFEFIDGTSDFVKSMDTKFDIVFIDGDHTYEWAKRDWDNVQGHLTEKAIVIFDDLDWGDHGVLRFFESLNKTKETKYIDGSPSYGIVYCD